VEAPQHELAWIVRHGKRSEPFSRDKLFLSLYRSCEHRPAALKDAAALTDTVMWRLAAQARDGALEGRDIVQITQVALNRFDKAASVHYQARHKG
jgi:transcriptional regulator NrdR family protein